MNPYVIIGIDPSITATGFVIVLVQSDSLTIQEHVTIKIPMSPGFDKNNGQDYARYWRIADEIEKLIQDCPRSLTLVAAESTFVGSNANTAYHLATARAIQLTPMIRRGFPVYDYAPTSIKMAVAHGRATKEEVMANVRLLYSLGDDFILDEHQADALAAAWLLSNDYSKLFKLER
jgi:crossover junction endodeoxyribonuclease RuvC